MSGAGERADRGAAVHHWLIALLVGALAGGVAVLAVWIVVRVLF